MVIPDERAGRLVEIWFELNSVAVDADEIFDQGTRGRLSKGRDWESKSGYKSKGH